MELHFRKSNLVNLVDPDRSGINCRIGAQLEVGATLKRAAAHNFVANSTVDRAAASKRRLKEKSNSACRSGG